MSDQRVEPIPEFYVVQPGRLLAGNYPTVWNREEQPHKLRHLLEEGVTFFVDLTEEGELAPYTPLLQAETSALDIAVEHQRMPVRDFDIPTVKRMKFILDTIDGALAADHTVYVHCHYGIGRTGTVVGCYLVRHGWSGEEALAELVRLRQGTYLEGMSSPVTLAQRHMVKDWPAGG